MRRWLVPLCVFIVTCAAFWSAADAQFVNLDDDQNFVHNARFRGLGAEHLRWMFSTAHMGHYQPLSWVTFGLDYALWGLDAPKYHAASIVWHALAALCVVALSRAIFERALPHADGARRDLTAGLAALLFAVHPLRAESVAWVTGRNDIIAGLFFALAAGAWMRAAPQRELSNARARWASALAGVGLVLGLSSIDLSGRDAIALRGLGLLGLALAFGCWLASVFWIARSRTRSGAGSLWYVLASLCILLSLLGKAYAIMAPFVFLVLDVWPLRRLAGGKSLRSLLHEKAPLFALTAGFGLVAAWAKVVPVASLKTLGQHTLSERIVQAFYGLGFYPAKTLVPRDLIPMVDLPATVRAGEPRFLISIVAVTLVTLALVVLRRRFSAACAAWTCYGLLILPVLGLTQSGAQLVADRYSYVACIPFALLGAGAVLCVAERVRGTSERALVLAGAPLIVFLSVLTWRQAARWRDSETIYAHGIGVGQSPRLLTNLAMIYNQRAFEEPALRAEHLGRALELSGEALSVAHERDLLAPEMRLHRGTILYNLERLEEAERELRAFVEAQPEHAQGLLNLGLVLNRLGRFSDAAGLLRRAVRQAPSSPDAWRYLGLALEGTNERAAALQAYERALELLPGQPMAQERLALLRASEGGNH